MDGGFRFLAYTAVAAGTVLAASARQRQVTVVTPLAGEKWWGGILHRGWEMPYGNTPRPIDLGLEGGVTVPYILDLARHAARTGEPIVCTMEYEFPHAGFAKPMMQFMLGPKWLVSPVTAEDDAVTVELPAGRWTDDLGTVHVGPKTLTLTHVPLGRLPRYARTETAK